jgi:hypothetical protein
MWGFKGDGRDAMLQERWRGHKNTLQYALMQRNSLSLSLSLSLTHTHTHTHSHPHPSSFPTEWMAKSVKCWAVRYIAHHVQVTKENECL